MVKVKMTDELYKKFLRNCDFEDAASFSIDISEFGVSYPLPPNVYKPICKDGNDCNEKEIKMGEVEKLIVDYLKRVELIFKFGSFERKKNAFEELKRNIIKMAKTIDLASLAMNVEGDQNEKDNTSNDCSNTNGSYGESSATDKAIQGILLSNDDLCQRVSKCEQQLLSLAEAADENFRRFSDFTKSTDLYLQRQIESCRERLDSLYDGTD